MNSSLKKITSLLALFLFVCLSQAYLGASFAAEDAKAAVATPFPPRGLSGVLTSVGDKPATIDGAAAITGTTVLDGATIETPNGAAASISLNTLGSVDMEQDTRIKLTFQANRINVFLLAGCVTVHANKGITGEIETLKDVVLRTDPRKADLIRVCHPDSVAMAPIAVAAGGDALATVVAIALPAVALLPVILPGDNPSNSIPD